MDKRQAEAVVRERLLEAQRHLDDFRNVPPALRAGDAGLRCSEKAVAAVIGAVEIAAEFAGVPSTPPFPARLTDGNDARMLAFKLALVAEQYSEKAGFQVADAVPRHSLVR